MAALPGLPKQHPNGTLLGHRFGSHVGALSRATRAFIDFVQPRLAQSLAAISASLLG